LIWQHKLQAKSVLAQQIIKLRQLKRSIENINQRCFWYANVLDVSVSVLIPVLWMWDVAVASVSRPRNIGVLTVCVFAVGTAAAVVVVAAAAAVGAAVPPSSRFAAPGRDSPAPDAGAPPRDAGVPPPGAPSTPRCCECDWSCALAEV